MYDQMPVICSGVKGINSKKITYVIEVFFRISKTFCFLHRYENDYVSVKENIRSLWDSVDQLETVCQAGRRTTVTLPATQSPIKHKSAASTSEQLARFIQGFSEEKAFLRKSLLDLNDSFSREYTTWTNTVEKKFNVINEIDAKCSSTEKNVEKLRDAQTALMKEIERKSEKLSAEVSALQVMINQALEEVIQNSILNQPSSCIDLIKTGVTNSGVYTLHYKMQPFVVYCLMGVGSGYTFISPETYMNIDIGQLSNDNTHVLIRHRKTNGFQYETRIEQISRYSSRPLSIQYNTHTGYAGVINRLMTPYIYVGLNPIKLVGRGHKRDRQGYKSNGKEFTFINCDGNPNGYFAFLFNHNNVSPVNTGESPAISRKWIDTSTRVTGDVLPDRFMSFFEIHFGGCGAFVGTNHIRDVTGAAVGIPYILK